MESNFNKNSNETKEEKIKEFGLSSLSINNSTSIFILTVIIALFGILAYVGMPKEQFPEIRIPMVYINTMHPGNSPVDIESLITRPIEKELKSVKGVKEIISTSAQDFSVITVEFNEDIETSKALQDTKDAVDKAKSELPTDLDQDPNVQEMDFSEIPIMVINLSGDFEIQKLKDYAEDLADDLEEFREVSRVDITGSVEREIQINADLYTMDAMQIAFSDISDAISRENVTMSGGDVKMGNGFRRSLRVDGEFKEVSEIRNVIVKSEDQNTIYLKDLADVEDSYVERKSYARLATNSFNDKGAYPVVSLKVVKRGGENLIDATDKINVLLDEARATYLPPNLDIVITESQSKEMKTSLNNLENSIISGMILVVVVLLFFMGLRNALFVGIAIPMSMFLSFLILSVLGVTINMVVLFALILALGMLVDNAIVVIENIYRLREQGLSKKEAAKQGTGEVALAIISSTATTLAAFVPLAFWGGIMGEFMKYLPITLITVLASSLFVGLVINPVIAYRYMKVDDEAAYRTVNKKKVTVGLILIGLSIPAYILRDTYALGNLLMLGAFIALLDGIVLKRAAHFFQHNILTRLESVYLSTLEFALKGKTPYALIIGNTFFLFFAIAWFGARLGSGNVPIEFFPDSDPRYVYMYVEAPQGTDVEETNKIALDLEKRLYKELLPYKDIIESIVSNVGENTNDPQDNAGNSVTPNRARIAVGFVPYEERGGVSSKEVKALCERIAKDIPGVEIVTSKDQNGPPTGKPISIELKGEDYIVLIEEANKMKSLIEQSDIEGVDKLSVDISVSKPELLVNIDRNKARRFGVSTGMLANNMRTAIYGQEVSKFKDGEDDYPIQLRLKDEYRYDLSTLNDQRITFRDNKGAFHQVPVSSVASLDYSTTVGEIKRKDLDRVVTLSSNITEGYNAQKVVGEVKGLLAEYKMPSQYSYKFGGEQEDQAESMAFLSRAMMIAVCAIFLILVSQFNSFVKPFIIIISVVLSLIGVLLGLIIFNDPFVIIMTGIGIISLAGIVVNNAIVLIDCADQLVEKKKDQLGLLEDERLPIKDYIECIQQAGFTRLRPVLLTAITTVLGLIPLATGMNIDFFGMFAHFDPDIYFGGPNADTWGPMAWTVIYGLTFATFLTLVIVPVMLLLTEKMGQAFGGLSAPKKEKKIV
ncbi:efflux RND transporter permease subunit [Flammeovirga agarivorans]|uniref:Efflux RND transporter permease subunit n=1 Tax=Flammeovirga agarivorans TaxID=2726742 RepID=A0A7X8SMY3_9BACT|nr:efflux RND transporter permease subunit [Flammeovirga agarivorans]NLR93174.1 efflux RND transporter permease subunit [Flammeovirga agarivorans]